MIACVANQFLPSYRKHAKNYILEQSMKKWRSNGVEKCEQNVKWSNEAAQTILYNYCAKLNICFVKTS